MDAQHSPIDDLTDLEKRLSRCQPSAAGLDGDRMLFAAGRASARGWRIWAGATGLMALLAVGLGVALQVERTERLALAHELALRGPTIEPSSSEVPPSLGEPASDRYLHLRDLILEKGIEAWPEEDVNRVDPANRSPSTPILQVWSRDGMIEQ